MKVTTSHCVILSILLLFLISCQGGSDERLQRAGILSDKSPDDAAALLDSIDRSSLSEADRHHFDLLTIKTNDKRFIRHTSDSLILDVLDYYSSHKSSPLYTEALYYAGRVYSDKGDSRTALKYYHAVIDLVRDNDSDTSLRIRALSQAAWLLSKIRLYDEAMPYLEEVISLEKEGKDSVRLSNDLLILGGIYLNQENFDLAEKNYQLAKSFSVGKDGGQELMADVSLAALHHTKGDNSKALQIIRSVLERDSLPDRNFVFSWAAKIYEECGLLDSAYMYADRLVHSGSPDHKRSGFELLLSDRMLKIVPADSLLPYIHAYRDVLENFYESHSAELAVEEQANYNYNIHLRERENAENAMERWKSYFYIAVLTGSLVGVFFLWKDNKNKRRIIRLQKANADMDTLLRNLQTGKSAEEVLTDSPMPQTNEELREILKTKVSHLLNAGTDNTGTPASILYSEAYKSVLAMLDDNKIIKEDSEIWKALESVVLNESPNFRKNLSLLVGREVSRMELNIALLIKCGFAPMKIASVIGKEKGTVSYYRSKWSKNIFGKNIGNESMDTIIRML